MIIDEKGRLFSKISIVDILVLIFVVCAALFVGFKFFAPAENITGAQETAYEYTFKVENVRQPSVDALKRSEGKWVYDSKGTFLGTLKQVVLVEPYKDAVTMPDGSMVSANVPDKYSVRAMVDTVARKTTDSIMISNKAELSVGSHLSVTTPEITVEVVITGINAK